MKMEELVQKQLRQVFKDDSLVFDTSRFAGGLTNYNYIMEIQGTEYVIRKPGGMTNLMIDRVTEKKNSAIVSELGLNSECIYFDDLSGVKISVFIPDSRNIAQNNPCSAESIQAVTGLMKRVHESATPFVNDFDWIDELEKYEGIVRELNGDLFFDYEGLKRQLFQYMKESVGPMKRVPCHNDTVPENFVLSGTGEAFLIDWEYAGMNDPSWDVAAYILESKLGEEPIDLLIQGYYGEMPSESELTKIRFYMLAQDLLWTVWALIRHYNGEDFIDYCYLRYERFRKNMRLLQNCNQLALAELVRNG